METSRPPKPLYWLGSFRGDLRSLPEPVVDTFGYALYLAQAGGRHAQAKPLRGFGSAGVLEVVDDWRGDTYRAVYTVRFAEALFVLPVFQKKSTRGIAMPKHDMELIRARLSVARRIAQEVEP